MLNMPVLKFDKSIKYLETQTNIQKNNKQLILDIITNIGLILNTSSANNNEHLKNVLETANDFLQNISNNIITLEQLNLEISNIKNELNDIISSKSQTPKTKEYYIAAFSNIKNNIEQYTESFQEAEKKLDIDNSDFNNFIKENDFKYTLNETENSENNYELTSFSVNNEVTSISSDEDTNEKIEDSIYSDSEDDVVELDTDSTIENISEKNIAESSAETEITNENNVAEQLVEAEVINETIVETNNEVQTVNEVSFETTNNEEIVDENNQSNVETTSEVTEQIEIQTPDINNTTENINENNVIIEEIPALSINDINTLSEQTRTELDPAELEKKHKIDELTNEFKEILTNLYDTGITDFDFTSALTNSFQEILPNTKKSEAEDIDLELLEEIAFSDELLNGNAPTKEVADTIVVDDIVYDNPSILEDTIVDDIVSDIIENPTQDNLLESLIEKDSTINEEKENESLLDSLIKENSLNEESVIEKVTTKEELIEPFDVEKDIQEKSDTEEIVEESMEELINSIIDSPIVEENIKPEPKFEDDTIKDIEVSEPITESEEPEINILDGEFEEAPINEIETPIEDHGLPELDDSILEEIFATNDSVKDEYVSPLEEISSTEDIFNRELTNLLNDELGDHQLHNYTDSNIETKKIEESSEEKQTTIEVSEYHKIQPVIDETMPIDQMIDMIKAAEAKSKVLIISEKTNSIYLPYRISELRNYMEYYPNVYDSLADVVSQEFILNLSNFREHPAKARFTETYNLIKNRSGKTVTKALTYALKLSNMKNLDPAIIAACKSDYELDCFLDCLNHNKLNSFKFFKIFYDANPI